MIVRVEFGLRGPGQNQDSGRKPDGPSAQGVATHIDGSNAVDGRLWWRVHPGTLVVVSWTLSWVCECVGEVVTRRPPATSRVPHRRHTRSPSPCPDRSRPSHSKSWPSSGVTAGVCCLPPIPTPGPSIILAPPSPTLSFFPAGARNEAPPKKTEVIIIYSCARSSLLPSFLPKASSSQTSS